MAYASVEDRIKVQQNIYKPRHPSNMRRQFYAAGNRELSDSSDDEIAQRCASRLDQKQVPTLKQINMSLRYERSRFQKGRSSDLMRFCGEAVLNKQNNEKKDPSEQPGSSVVDTQT